MPVSEKSIANLAKGKKFTSETGSAASAKTHAIVKSRKEMQEMFVRFLMSKETDEKALTALEKKGISRKGLTRAKVLYARLCEKGFSQVDVNAIKLAFQLAGVLTEKTELDANVNSNVKLAPMSEEEKAAFNEFMKEEF